MSQGATAREYRINLRRAYWAARTRRARRAVNIIREFAARHLKTNVSNIRIDSELNSYIWSKGLEKPPRAVDVVAERREDGSVVIKLKK